MNRQVTSTERRVAVCWALHVAVPLTEDDRPVGRTERWRGVWEKGAWALPRHGAAGQGLWGSPSVPPTTALTLFRVHSHNPHQTWRAGNGDLGSGLRGVQSPLVSRKQGWPSPGAGEGAGRCAVGTQGKDLGLPRLCTYVQRYGARLKA